MTADARPSKSFLANANLLKRRTPNLFDEVEVAHAVVDYEDAGFFIAGVRDAGWQKPGFATTASHIPFFASELEFGASCFYSRTSSGKLSATNITAAVTSPTVIPSHQ